MSAASPWANSLESLFGELVTALTNVSLKLDPRSEPRLRALEGRCIHLVAELPAPLAPKTLTVVVTDGRLEIFAQARAQPNAIARGSLPDLATWLVRGGAGAGRITLQGDETVLHELTAVLHAYTPDLSGPISALVGSEVTANLLNIAEGTVAAMRSALEGAGSAIKRETAQRYVTRFQLDTFLDVLDDTRSRVDRLNERVRTQEARATPGPPSGHER